MLSRPQEWPQDRRRFDGPEDKSARAPYSIMLVDLLRLLDAIEVGLGFLFSKAGRLHGTEMHSQ